MMINEDDDDARNNDDKNINDDNDEDDDDKKNGFKVRGWLPRRWTRLRCSCHQAEGGERNIIII